MDVPSLLEFGHSTDVAAESQNRSIKGYVGIPFVDGGRDRKGCDCWGLVRLIHAAEAGIELPAYGEVSAYNLIEVARNVRGALKGPDWRRVDAEPRRPLDIVLMVSGIGSARPWHLGVMMDARRVLHTEAGADSHFVPLGDISMTRRVLGFARHWRLS